MQSHCSPPAQRFSASSCFCFVPLGSCGTADPPAGKEKATQQCNLPDYVPHTHFVSWDQRHRSHLLLVWFLSWRPAEKQSPSGLYCKGPDLHGSTYRLMKAFGALCDILGSAKSLSCKPDRFLPAWRPLDCGPCLGTDTTFDNDIDCSIFEVIITGLVGGHWANAISDGARLRTNRPTSDTFHQSLLWYFSPWCCLTQSDLQSAVVLLHIPSYPGMPSASGPLCGWGCWAPMSAQPYLMLSLYSHSCLYPSEWWWRKHMWPQDHDLPP